MASVSAAMRRRITNHLDAGFLPSAKGNRVVLRDISLVQANGTETPAATEVRLQAASRGIPINLAFWDVNTATTTQGNQTFAYDIAGNRHIVARKRLGERVATKQGRRFYEEAPQTQWIVHVPVIHYRISDEGRRRYFHRRHMQYNPVTKELADRIYFSWKHGPDSLEAQIYNLSRTRDGADSAMQISQMREAWGKVFAPGTNVGIAYDWLGSEEPDGVLYEVTNDPLRFSVQREGVSRTGERTIDTFLDQIVFGLPVTSFDLWQNQNSTKQAGGPITSVV